MQTVDHQLKKPHPLFKGEGSFKVGAKRIAKDNGAMVDTSLLGPCDDVVHASNLLLLCPIVVAPGECIAQLNVSRVLPCPHIDLGIVLVSSLKTPGIEDGGRVDYTRLGHKPLRYLVYASHL